MFIRKFYDAAVAEPKYKIGDTLDSKEFFSQEVNEVETEEAVEEKKEEQPEKKEEIVESKKEEIKTESAKSEEKKEEQPESDWREIVKKQDRKELFKVLEIDEDAIVLGNELKKDEFINKLVTYRKNNGNLNPFIEAATTDWSKFSHEQLIMNDLKKQYSNLSEAKSEKLAKSDFNSRFIYKDDPNLTEEENHELAELTAIKLEAEGEKIRAIRIASQKEYLDSVKPIEKIPDETTVKKAIEDYQRKMSDDAGKFKSMIESDPAKSKLLSSKQITLGTKEKSFNRSVSTDTILEQTYDVNKFDDLFWENGKFNFEKWAKVSAYANDIDGFEDSLINHGMSLNTKQLSEKELENAKEEKQDKKEEKKKSLAKTFATEGVPIRGEDL